VSALLRETCRHPASRLAMLTAALAIVSLGCGSGSTSVMEPSGPKCQVTVANSLESVPASGATGTLTVSTARDCTWAVSSNAGWLTVFIAHDLAAGRVGGVGRDTGNLERGAVDPGSMAAFGV